MPEGLEAEISRRAAERCVGRTITSVTVDERQREADALLASLPGRRIVGARRHGKLVLLDLRPRLVLGLHFGMTGRLVVDGAAPIEALEYGSGRDDAGWNRFVVRFRGRPPGELRVNDPRRWATFTLDPDTARLGPDFLAAGERELAVACAGRRAPLKAVLLDQSAIAGYGNMCVDEILWQAGLAPARPAHLVTPVEIATFAAQARVHLPAMLDRGGSHTGVLSPEVRAAVPACPRDGASMRRDTVGGRTTVWCPAHQR